MANCGTGFAWCTVWRWSARPFFLAQRKEQKVQEKGWDRAWPDLFEPEQVFKAFLRLYSTTFFDLSCVVPLIPVVVPVICIATPPPPLSWLVCTGCRLVKLIWGGGG